MTDAHPSSEPSYDFDIMTREELIESCQEIATKHDRLLAGVQQWASECGGCDGTGESAHEFGKPCADCADIRKLLAENA